MAQHPKTYFFFVNGNKYETEMETVTVAYIKSRIQDLPANSGLQLEGHGNDPDIFLNDDSKTISLDIGHGEGPKHFTVVPPATFG